jgi:hypothetical protein
VTRVLALVIGILVALFLFTVALLDRERTARAQQEVVAQALTEALNRAQERAKLDRKVLVAREAEKAASRAALEKAQQALQNALQRNKPWSDTDVPPDIQNALTGAAMGLPGPLPDGL